MPSVEKVPSNVKRSIQAAIAVAASTWGVPVLFDEAQAKVPESGAWVDVHWGSLPRGTRMPAGQKQKVWVVFLDCISRLKDDELGGRLDELADKVRAFGDEALVPLSDYSTPAAPVPSGTNARLSVQGDDPMETTEITRGRSIALEVTYYER